LEEKVPNEGENQICKWEAIPAVGEHSGGRSTAGGGGRRERRSGVDELLGEAVHPDLQLLYDSGLTG
jgi:hypothetical protein